jgi:P pilus assembly chaperone PapD
MIKVFRYLLIVGLSLSAFVTQAEFSLDKYRIVLTDNERRTDLLLQNVTGQFGNYRVTLVDLQMNNEGLLEPVENFKYSAKRLLRASPRMAKNVTPHSYQKIRIKARAVSEPGELRTHMLIEELLPPYEGDLTGMIIRPNFKTLIPVFIISGKVTVTVSATDFVLNAKTQALTFTLKRSGNSSAFGNVVFYNASGETVFRQNGIGLYRELDQRIVTVKVDEKIQSLDGLVFKFERSVSNAVLFESSL